MDLELLNKAMKAEAKSLGLCDEWFGEWSENTSIDGLLQKYIRGIDFVIEKGFPDNETLKKYAGDRLHYFGIYVDEEINDEADNAPTLVINGKCEGVVTYNGFSAGNIYLRGESDLTIMVYNSAKVFVEVYDNARLQIINDGISKCFVYKHGGRIEPIGKVMVRDKRKK